MTEGADPSVEAVEGSALDRLVRIGGQSFLLEMIDLFLANAPQRIEAAQAALADGDYRTVYRTAHSLKSTAGNVGARALQATAARLEERAAVQDEAAIPPLVEELAQRWEKVRDRLEAERKRRSAS